MFALRLLLVEALFVGSLTSPWRVLPETLQGDSPEIYMDFCQLVTYHGYHCEEYRNVQTSDGYLLTIHRVNGKQGETISHNRKPVFLQHGLIASSDSFVLNPPNDSLPYILSDAGFDVWLGNSRGNIYSMKHIKYNVRQKEFWDFSWQEMSLYDLPTSIEFVLNETNSKSIPYIGHSQGNLMAFVREALTNDSKITRIIALAPIFHVEHIGGPFKYLVPFRNAAGPFFEALTHGEFLPHSNLSVWAANHLCDHPLLVDICEDIFFILMGKDSKYMNKTRVPIYISHMPDGCSVRDMLHYAQMMVSGNCSFYDFGFVENMIKYNQPSPPVFTAQQITIPVSLFAGGKDLLADDKDVDYLRKNLPNLVNDMSVPDWNHVDFLTATNMPEKISKLIISILNSN